MLIAIKKLYSYSCLTLLGFLLLARYFCHSCRFSIIFETTYTPILVAKRQIQQIQLFQNTLHWKKGSWLLYRFPFFIPPTKSHRNTLVYNIKKSTKIRTCSGKQLTPSEICITKYYPFLMFLLKECNQLVSQRHLMPLFLLPQRALSLYKIF